MCFQFMQTEVWGVYVEMDTMGWKNGGRNMRLDQADLVAMGA